CMSIFGFLRERHHNPTLDRLVPTTMVAATGGVTTMADTGWSISTVAGTGACGYAGDGGAATQAELNNPFDLAVAPDGRLGVSDTYNHGIRRIEARTGIITTIAGSGHAGAAGDGGPAMQAQMNQPYGIVIDRRGNIYVADRLNGRVRRIDGSSGVITTLAGDGS